MYLFAEEEFVERTSSDIHGVMDKNHVTCKLPYLELVQTPACPSKGYLS